MSVGALLPQELLTKTLRRELSQCSRFQVGMALITSSGLDALLPDIEKALKRGATGEFLFGIDLPSDPDAIEKLLALAERFAKGFLLRRFASPKSRYFHIKLWLFEARVLRAILGSSNFTQGGLVNNYEANILVGAPAATTLASFFEELFDGAYARPVTPRWLARYRDVWKARDKNREAAERLRAKALRTASGGTRSIPKQIRGNTFVFTGRILKWPRDRRLYPYVRRLGGAIGLKASAIPEAAALVQGELMGGEDTVKLRAARKIGALVLTQEEFFAIAKAQKRHRS